jgi:hypothetical protein
VKKCLAIAAVVGALVLALGVAGFAFADSPARPNLGAGPGMMGRGGGMWNRGSGQEGPLHDVMVASMAKALGMDAATLEQRLDAGETMWQVAQSKGLSADQFNTAMQQARTDALKQAVADGTITQAQADRMAQHMGQGLGATGRGLGSGPCGGTGTPMGRGQGGVRWSTQSS